MLPSVYRTVLYMNWVNSQQRGVVFLSRFSVKGNNVAGCIENSEKYFVKIIDNYGNQEIKSKLKPCYNT